MPRGYLHSSRTRWCQRDIARSRGSNRCTNERPQLASSRIEGGEWRAFNSERGVREWSTAATGNEQEPVLYVVTYSRNKGRSCRAGSCIEWVEEKAKRETGVGEMIGWLFRIGGQELRGRGQRRIHHHPTVNNPRRSAAARQLQG